MNKFFLWGIAICLSAIATPILFSLGSSVTAKSLQFYELDFYNPNNILGSVAGALLVLALTSEVLINASWVYPLYEDVITYIAAGIFKNPQALAQSHAFTYQQAFESLKIFVFPRLKVVAAGCFIILVFTALFPLPLAFVAFIYLASVAVEVTNEGKSTPWNSVVRGFTRRQGADLAKKWVGKNTKKLIAWGASFIPKLNEAFHYLIIGGTGTGKSVWRETMMKKALPGNKAIINDPKPSQSDGMVPLLVAIGSNYYILNPYDYRCSAWWIGRDINSEPLAYELATYIFPVSESSDGRFFDEAARIALSMIIYALIVAQGEDYTLRQIILYAVKDYFEVLIKKFHPRPNQFDEFLKAKKMEGERNDILLTLQAKLMQFSVIAALWERAPDKIAFKDYVQDSFPKNSAIIMGSDSIHAETINLVNAMMFAFAAKYLKALPPNRKRRIWIFLDEAASEKTPPFPGIESVMALGRGAGICCCLGFHSISLLKRTYGELAALGIFGLARHLAIFGVDNETAEFLSKALGNYEYIEQSYGSSSSVSSTPQGTNYTTTNTTNSKLSSRPVYLAQEFQDMNRPPTGPENGLLGDFIAPGEGIHRHHYTWEEITNMLPPRSEEVEAYQRIPEGDPATVLKPLTEEEIRTLFPHGIKQRQPRQRKSQKKQNP